MCSTSFGVLPTANSPWLAMSTAAFGRRRASRPRRRARRCRSSGSRRPRRRRRRTRRTPRCTRGSAVRVRANIVAYLAWQCIVASISSWSRSADEVQRLLGGRAALALEHVAVEVADHEVVERHLQVVERRRREHHVAVGQAGAEVAGGALHEVRCAASPWRPRAAAPWSPAAVSVARCVVSAIEDLRVHEVVGPPAGEQRGEAVGDQLRVVRLGVVGRAADVRREHDVRPSSTADGRAARFSPTKWSRPAPPRWPDWSAATSASVSCSCARAELTKIAPVLHRARTARRRSSPSVSGVTAACIDTTSASASRSSSECVASGVVRVVAR